MNESEFEVLDELYFVISYTELVANLEMTEAELKETLINLVKKGWVRVYDQSKEIELSEFNMDQHFRSYFYLASKKGLMAHNQ